MESNYLHYRWLILQQKLSLCATDYSDIIMHALKQLATISLKLSNDNEQRALPYYTTVSQLRITIRADHIAS